MTTELDQALSETIACQNFTRDKEIVCVIDGKPYPTVESAFSGNEVFIDGGIAIKGGFQEQVSVFLFDTAPKQLQSIVSSDGQELQIQSVNKVNDSYVITAYDPAAQTQ